ncbi:arylamine N-acetyltransferase family protein [Vibrio sp. 10N]|uniref:arylamine N-acetyltransferase family protein n=1 Tax=Vibrio sp. 10N TaxID=3058938 RepID=UPI002814513F|nr:arylamine N-acetyltransferase [Vibrio sp. 10N]
MSPNQLQQYLNRVDLTLSGVDGGVVSSRFLASYAHLTQLQKAQHLTIPFENFDVFAGEAISLEPEVRFDKLVNQSRGGYCFEVNALFLEVLSSLGYHAKPKLARVHLADTPSGRSHQVTLVTIKDEQWVVDVGFGSNTPRSPIKLVANIEQQADFQVFRFIEVEDFGYLLQRRVEEGWQDLYSLDMTFVGEGDIEYANHYTSTSTNTVFTQSMTAALATKEGSVTLLDTTLRCRHCDQEVWALDLKQDHYFEVIEKEMGIVFPEEKRAHVLARLYP